VIAFDNETAKDKLGRVGTGHYVTDMKTDIDAMTGSKASSYNKTETEVDKVTVIRECWAMDRRQETAASGGHTETVISECRAMDRRGQTVASRGHTETVIRPDLGQS